MNNITIYKIYKLKVICKKGELNVGLIQTKTFTNNILLKYNAMRVVYFSLSEVTMK